jgi:hypothetical protein
MADHRNARNYAATRLRSQANELVEQAEREPDSETKREMVERADLLERSAEMLDMDSGEGG